jgi:hypothetical protein
MAACTTVAQRSADELTVAQVDGGKVRGTAANGLIAFKGIPFAFEMQATTTTPRSSVRDILWPALVVGGGATVLGLAYRLEQSQWWSAEELLAHEDLLALDEALTRLAAADLPADQLVQLRYFARLPIPEAARTLGVSPGRRTGSGPSLAPGFTRSCRATG